MGLAVVPPSKARRVGKPPSPALRKKRERIEQPNRVLSAIANCGVLSVNALITRGYAEDPKCLLRITNLKSITPPISDERGMG